MPLASRAVASVLSVSIENGFRIVGWISAISLLIAIFTLSRCFTENGLHALAPMVILGLSATHIKFPLFCYTFVDVAAYPLIVLAFWALVTNRPNLCLAISSIGVFFKEFLAIPLVLVILQTGLTYWRSRSRRDFLRFAVAAGIGMSVVLIPRLCIPVNDTVQFLDPLNRPRSLWNLFAPLDEFRVFNVMYAAAGYWLPTLLLLTRARFNRAWADLRGFRLRVMAIYLFLVLLLTMYGGTNISIFVSYSVAVQVIVLALFFRYGVSLVEVAYVIVVMLLYNKIALHIPQPRDAFDAYIDFYGGWSSRVTLPTLMRSIELVVYIILGICVRTVAAKVVSDGQQDAPAHTGRPDR